MYNWRANRDPVVIQRHFSGDVTNWFDIVPVFANDNEVAEIQTCPDDLFSDELLEEVEQVPSDAVNSQKSRQNTRFDICLASPTVCLQINLTNKKLQLPELNGQVDSEILRSLSAECKPELIQTTALYNEKSQVTGFA